MTKEKLDPNWTFPHTPSFACVEVLRVAKEQAIKHTGLSKLPYVDLMTNL